MAEPQSAARLLRRPEVAIEQVWKLAPPPAPLDPEVSEQVEIQTKYKGYIERQLRDLDRFKKAEGQLIPTEIDYLTLRGLPQESKERLDTIRPSNFGQAARISGIRASDITMLHIIVEKMRRESTAPENAPYQLRKPVA